MPTNQIRKRILFSINKEEVKHARIYFLISIITIVASVPCLFFSVQYMIQAFYESSFFVYVSLIFWNPNVVVSYWGELSVSLLETLPIFGILVSLIVVNTFLISIRVLVKNSRGRTSLLFNN